jgi:hypothetical protein
MNQVSDMLEHMRELSAESAVEIRKQDPEYSGLNYSQDPGYGAVPPQCPVDLIGIFKDSSVTNVIQPYSWNTLTPSGHGNVTVLPGTGSSYNSPFTFSNNNVSADAKITSSQIELNGAKADIRINGVSLLDTLKTMQDRLNVLIPNPVLEQEWDQLRELGEQYRELEKKLKEQGDMWARLKAMPPSEIE